MGKLLAGVFRNMSVVFAGELMSKAFEFLFVLIAANHLGAAGFGVLSFALAFTALFSFITDMGLYHLTVRELARDKAKARSYLADIAGLKAVLSALVYVGMACALYALGYPPLVYKLVLVVGASMILESFNLLFNSVFQAHERLEYSAVGRVLSSLALFCVAIASGLFGWGIWGFALAYVVARGLNALYGLMVTSARFFKPTIRFNTRLWPKLIRESWPFGLTLLLTNIFLSTDLVVLSFFRGDVETGVYAAAAKMVLALGFILAAYNQAVYPVLSRLHKRADDFNLVSGFYLKSMLFLAAPMVAVTLAESQGIISLLYKSEYLQSARVLSIIIFSAALAYASSPFHRILDASGRQRTVFKSILAGTILNAVLNLAFIPRYGITAAAYATVAGQLVFLTIPLAVCARQGLMPKLTERYIQALTGASIVLLAAVHYTSSLPTVPRILAILTAYTIAYASAGGLREIVHLESV